jgi:VIT1/CCC1 family predicted Fe2+/Mn2+ transporter
MEFMMRFELGLERPEPQRAVRSALTIGGAYVAGGLVPLLPYFFSPAAPDALGWSAGITLLALFAFGWVKGRFTGAGPLRSAVQTTLVGSIAATAAFGIARLIAH